MLDPTADKVARHNWFRAINTIARANLESWFYSPRTIVALVFSVAVCFMEVSGLNRTLAANQITFFYGETMFHVYNSGCNILMMSTMLLITVCELPKRFSYQNNILIRSSRREFLVGQILYCLWIVVITLLLIALCTSIFTAGHLAEGQGWSDNARVAAEEMHEDDTVINEFFRENMTPGVATLYAIAPMFFFWFTMMLTILACSVFGKPIAGVVLFAFILWSPVIFYFEALPRFPLPTEFALLRNFALQHRDEGMAYCWKVLAGYVVLDASIIVAMFFRIGHTDFAFSVDSKF